MPADNEPPSTTNVLRLRECVGLAVAIGHRSACCCLCRARSIKVRPIGVYIVGAFPLTGRNSLGSTQPLPAVLCEVGVAGVMATRGLLSTFNESLRSTCPGMFGTGEMPERGNGETFSTLRPVREEKLKLQNNNNSFIK